MKFLFQKFAGVFLLLAASSCVFAPAINGINSLIFEDLSRWGKSSFEEGNYHDSIIYLEHALQKNPNPMSLRMLLIKGYYFNGEHDKSRQQIKIAKTMFENRDDFFDELINFLYETDQHNELVTLFQDKPGIKRLTVSMLEKIIPSFLELSKNDEANTALAEYAKIHPPSAELYSLISWTFKNTDHLNEAIPALEKALELQPKNPIYHHNLGLLFDQKKDYSNAVLHLQKAIDLKDSAEAKKSSLYPLGVIYINQFQYKEALRAFSEASNYENAKDLVSQINAQIAKLSQIGKIVKIADLRPGKFTIDDIDDSHLQELERTGMYRHSESKPDFPQGSLKCVSDTHVGLQQVDLKQVVSEYIHSYFDLDDSQIIVEESQVHYPGFRQPIHYILRVKIEVANPFNRVERVVLEGLEKSMAIGMLKARAFCTFYRDYEQASSKNRSPSDYVFFNFLPSELAVKYNL